MTIPDKDREILRKLAARLEQISRLPVHKEKAVLWRKLNDREPVRPMVYINEIPWNEMNINDELTIGCSNPWARHMEDRFRKTIYQWEHMPGDMIISDYIPSPLVIHDTGLGVEEDVEIRRTDESSDVVSRKFHARITKPEDIEIIKDPVVTHDKGASAERLALMQDLFADIMPVKQEGVKGFWFTPWDNLIRLWGVEQAMMDLVLRPEMVNAIVSRFVEASMIMLDQYENQNLLALGNDNTRVGSGGYGYTSELPGSGYDPGHVKPVNLWGCSNAQIFSEVSPEMHWEFAVKHDIPWLERWGMNYYGCCEPLDNKADVMKRIPRLRKISTSPWVNLDRAVRNFGDTYVYSRKPNPAILAEQNWYPERARTELTAALEKLKGFAVEVILKDISTVRYKPQRLWDWEKIAMEEVRKYE